MPTRLNIPHAFSAVQHHFQVSMKWEQFQEMLRISTEGVKSCYIMDEREN